MSAHKQSQALATAALMDIISKGKAIQAGAVRAASPADQETIRADAHTILDAYLDHMSDAGAHTRAIIED